MFLEEPIDDCIDYGSSFDVDYANDEVSTANGNVYTVLRHPYQMLHFTLGYENKLTDEQIDEIIDLYNRIGGRFGGFRFRHEADFSTNNYRDVPTFHDQVAPLADPEVPSIYQITRWYGPQNVATTPRRRIRKPAAGTVLVGIRNPGGDQQITAFTVDTTTGLITLSANKTAAVVSITQAAQAALEIGGNTFAVGDSVYFSGVLGMTEINGLRGRILTKPDGTHITVNINSTGFSAYASGGTLNTRPQGAEVILAGCEFDIPVRFEDNLDGVTYSNLGVMSSSVKLIEWLNPRS